MSKADASSGLAQAHVICSFREILQPSSNLPLQRISKEHPPGRIADMFKQTQSYDPVGSRDPDSELADWRQDPPESVEGRNKIISLHRKPGFYSTGLLLSVGFNAILLMVIGWQYMRLKVIQENSKAS